MGVRLLRRQSIGRRAHPSFAHQDRTRSREPALSRDRPRHRVQVGPLVHRRSLRLRLLVTFGLGALILSSLFASLTYFGVKHVLIDDQQQTDLRQSYRSEEHTSELQS